MGLVDDIEFEFHDPRSEVLLGYLLVLYPDVTAIKAVARDVPIRLRGINEAQSAYHYLRGVLSAGAAQGKNRALVGKVLEGELADEVAVFLRALLAEPNAPPGPPASGPVRDPAPAFDPGPMPVQAPDAGHVAEGARPPAPPLGLRWRLYTTCTDGTGAFLVAVLLIAASGWIFARAFHRQDAQRQTFYDLLTAEIEPYRSERLQVANAAVIVEIDKRLQRPGSSFCGGADFQSFKKIQSQFEFSINLPIFYFPLFTEPLEACDRPQCPSRTEDLLTDAAPDSALRVSRYVATDPLQRRLSLASRTIENLHAPSFVKIYFIARTGAVRVRGKERIVGLQHEHPFLGASYARALLSAPDAAEIELCDNAAAGNGYLSKPYVDLTGDGVVETACAPVRRNGVVAGVFCADRVLDRNLLQAGFHNLTHVFELTSVVLKLEDDQRTWSVRRCGRSECSMADRASEEAVDRIKDKLGRIYRKGPPSLGKAVAIDGDILVPAKTIDLAPASGQAVEAVLLRPHATQVIDMPLLLFGLSTLLVAGVVLAGSAKGQQQRSQQALLRALPTPVVITHSTPHGGDRARDVEHDVILFANSAAESLLGQKLPSYRAGTIHRLLMRAFGIAARPRKTFRSFVTDDTVDEYDRQYIPRDGGLESTYRVTLKENAFRDRVVRARITGRPRRRADGTVDTFGTLSVDDGDA